MDKKTVKEEVNRFRSQYREVHYSYDVVKQEKPQPAKSEETKN